MNAFTSFIIVCLVTGAYGGLPWPQIIGGTDAPDGKYPYQVSIRNAKANYAHFCGGAIISKDHIVTAAHCVIGIENPYLIDVAVGSNYLDKPGAEYRVQEIIVHLGFNSNLHIHDIALLRLTKDIKFDSNTQPIPLPTTNRDYDNYPLVATGWGRLKARGSVPNHLQEIILKGYSQSKCYQKYNIIRKYHICTLTKINEGMCNGDSGGPLVADGVLVGIVSFGRLPCGSGSPDVFTRVFHYRSWIQRHAKI